MRTCKPHTDRPRPDKGPTFIFSLFLSDNKFKAVDKTYFCSRFCEIIMKPCSDRDAQHNSGVSQSLVVADSLSVSTGIRFVVNKVFTVGLDLSD